MYISRGIVELHGGTINIHSAGEGQGSTFVVELDIDQTVGFAADGTQLSHATDVVVTEARPKIASDAQSVYSGPKLKILVVDDAPSIRKIMGKSLPHFGFCNIDDLHMAVDGDEGLAMMLRAMQEGSMYDVVIMDYEMPTKSGPQTVREVRALGYSGLVVGVTGNALQSDINHFLLEGANAVLTKPLDLRLFQEAITTVCTVL